MRARIKDQLAFHIREALICEQASKIRRQRGQPDAALAAAWTAEAHRSMIDLLSHSDGVKYEREPA
jgi:hypothetical protein